MSTATETDTVAAGFAERFAEQEELALSPLAARSYPALRARAEADCSLRTPFQRDRDRIVHSKAFRRLTHKTQVFVAPRGDHYRTRLTHTLEVTTISRTVARALRLNEDLVEAIGLGHDLGHPPFGHIGEEVLDDCLKKRFGRDFRHYEHSLRIVEHLERDGVGLNLTEQVRDGIARHSSRAPPPRTLEGRIVRVIDRVAYINHDIDDAVRAGLLSERELPASRSRCWGRAARRGSTRSCTTWSSTRGARAKIVQGPLAGPAMAELRELHVRARVPGTGGARRAREDRGGGAQAVRALRRSTPSCCRAAPGEALPSGEDELAQRVTDYLAGMTDRYCIRQYTELQVPRAFAR